MLIGQKIWEPPRRLIAVQGLLEIFGYFLLVLIGVELLETRNEKRGMGFCEAQQCSCQQKTSAREASYLAGNVF